MINEKQFVKLSPIKLQHLTIEELVTYRKRERAHLLQSKTPQTVHRIRKFAHPLLMGMLYIYHMAKKIKIKVNGSVPKTDRPIIFSVSHIGMYDVEVILQSVKRHVYILSGDEEAMYRTFDGWFFDANGVIYVDPEDSVDKQTAMKTAINFLKQGRSIMWFPEGTWNLSPNYVILPIHYGIIEAAVRANALIVPIGLEQYDKKHGINFVVNIGTIFDPALSVNGELTKGKKIELAEMLRSDMARLKLDAWEPMQRTKINSDYWDLFVADRFSEWPYYSMDIIRRREFNPSGFISDIEAFAHLCNISINSNNAFLARIKYKYLQELFKHKKE